MNQFHRYLFDIQRVIEQLPIHRLEIMVDRLHLARLNRSQIFVMGNGGSAATASHMACDLGKNTVVAHQPRVRIHALTDSMSIFSAYGNDCGYESVFAEQLANYVEPDDVVIAISASGNSENVLNAIHLANQHNAYTIGMSGYHGGKLAEIVDLPIVVPCHNIEQIEDIHLMLSHMVTMGLRNAAENPTSFFVKEAVEPVPALIIN